MPLDLEAHLLRQLAFSRATFGPGMRIAGVSDHIRKELAEVDAAAEALFAAMDKAANSSSRADYRAAAMARGALVSECVDVAILALDLALRAEAFAPHPGMDDVLIDPEAVAAAVVRRLIAKQGRNEGRGWPDWRTADPDKAIEHVRDGEDAR